MANDARQMMSENDTMPEQRDTKVRFTCQIEATKRSIKVCKLVSK